MKTAIIGAGNVAFHLANAIVKSGHEVERIFVRRTSDKRTWLQDFSVCNHRNLSELESTLCIIAVTDDAISDVLANYQFGSQMTVAHTSGAVSIEVFEASLISNFGCLYPVQTLTLHEQVDYRKLPLLIEGSSAKALADVEEIATSISEYVKRIDSDTRLRIHLACVFANNFTNHMLTIADDLLRAKDIPFDILEPLLKETISKAMKYGPENCQTGPAARNDQATMKKHLEMIVRPETKKIYEAISQRILESRQSKSTEE